MNLARYLLQNPNAQTEDGANLTDTVVGEIVNRGIANSMTGYPRQFNLCDFQNSYTTLHRGLEGFVAKANAGKL